MRHGPFVALAAFAFGCSFSGEATAQSRFFTFERNTDRPGIDYKRMPSRDAATCSFACQRENVCRAWTYVRPGVQGPSGFCWLKTAVPRAVASGCCTSGFRKQGPVRID